MRPKVSIIIPVYNVEKYLRECLDSVVAQTLTDWECICVDDGSTDSSPAILYKYATKDKRFRVYHQNNVGSGPARNKALDEATGEYVSFMDSDDRFANNNSLQLVYNAAKSSNCDLVGGGRLYISDNGVFLRSAPLKWQGVTSYKDSQQQYDYQNYLFSRRLIEKAHLRFPNLLRRQDPPFFVMSLLAAGHFYAIDEVVYAYRCRPVQRINWCENGGRRLRDHISGLQMVANMAQQHGLWNLYSDNVKCLTHLGAFMHKEEAFLVESDLKKFITIVRSSHHVSPETFVEVARCFASSEGMGERFGLICRFFGGRIAFKVAWKDVIMRSHKMPVLDRMALIYRRLMRHGEFAPKKKQ